MDRQNEFLKNEPIGGLMRRFATPCVVSLLVGALYNIVDQIFIANADYLGSYGNAANTVVFPLTVIALAIATMLGDGCCAFVSLSLGAKRSDDAHRGVGTSILALVAASFVLTAIYLAWMNPILELFGARVNEETFRLSREYFFYIALGVPFYMFGQALNPIIRSDGSPKFAMATLLTGAILNCILDPIFIYVLHWGMMGAAVATVLGQVASAVLALIYLFRMRAIRLNRDSFRFRFGLLKKIVPLGMTSFLSQISIVLSMAAVLNMVKKYGAIDPVFGQAEFADSDGGNWHRNEILPDCSGDCDQSGGGCIPIIGYNVGAGQKRPRARVAEEAHNRRGRRRSGRDGDLRMLPGRADRHFRRGERERALHELRAALYLAGDAAYAAGLRQQGRVHLFAVDGQAVAVHRRFDAARGRVRRGASAAAADLDGTGRCLVFHADCGSPFRRRERVGDRILL